MHSFLEICMEELEILIRKAIDNAMKIRGYENKKNDKLSSTQSVIKGNN